MTDNKELIPGMTEIMDHIKKLERENKELKEANKMLNNYNEANIKLRQEKEDEIEELKEVNEFMDSGIDKRDKEIENLKKQMKIVDNELSKARKYERFLEYKLDKENIDYTVPDDYEERDYDGSSSEEEDD